MKIGRRSAGQVALRGDIRRAQSLLSRPMTGHTLRKLPRLAAQSPASSQCLRAVVPFASLHTILHTRLNVKNFFGVFDKFFQKFLYSFPRHTRSVLRTQDVVAQPQIQHKLPSHRQTPPARRGGGPSPSRRWWRGPVRAQSAPKNLPCSQGTTVRGTVVDFIAVTAARLR